MAGFLLGLLRDMSPEDTLIAACAAGASSVEAVDGTSGVESWDHLRLRIEGGWKQGEALPGDGWTASSREGISLGPADRERVSTGR